MTEQLIALGSITDNPYQPRVTDDPEHIEKLARSIASDGLLQTPKARVFGKNGSTMHQLAFGHSRRKAFEWLQANWKAQGLTERYHSYTHMPVELQDLTDEEMYRQAIAENVQRKDLNPIELAQAMIKYRDEFKKSSDDVGQLFGVNGATVRGLVRLLELPEPVKEKVASGEITQGAARKLLTIARVDESRVLEAADEIAAGDNPDDVVEETIRGNENAITMWESWHDGKARGGKGLWPLDITPDKFPMKYLPALRAADVAKAMGMEFTADLRAKIEDYMVSIGELGKDQADFVSQLADQHPQDADLIERIGLLFRPSACAGCPFHAVIDKTHYCGFKPCHQRKRKAWVQDEIEKLSKKLAIAIYDPPVDGKAVLALSESRWQDDYEQHAKLVKDQDPDLRLQSHNSGQYSAHAWTDSYAVRLVLVGKKVESKKEREQAKKERQQTQHENQQRQWQLEGIRRDAADKFTREYAFAFFAIVFKELTHVQAMSAFTQAKPKKDVKKADVLTALRMVMAIHAIERTSGYSYSLRQRGPTAMAKYLQGVATSWGVKLPKDFLDVAKGYEPNVSTETPKNGKKA
jgi:ParB/RepB/Spo0J family partition protein